MIYHSLLARDFTTNQMVVIIAVAFGCLIAQSVSPPPQTKIQVEDDGQAMKILSLVESAYASMTYYKDDGKFEWSVTSRIDGTIDDHSHSCWMEFHKKAGIAVQSDNNNIKFDSKQLVLATKKISSARSNRPRQDKNFLIYMKRLFSSFEISDLDSSPEFNYIGVRALTEPYAQESFPQSFLIHLLLGKDSIKTLCSKAKNISVLANEPKDQKHRKVVLIEFADRPSIKLYISEKNSLIEQIDFIFDQQTALEQLPFVSKIKYFRWVSETISTVKTPDVESHFRFAPGVHDIQVKSIEELNFNISLD